MQLDEFLGQLREALPVVEPDALSPDVTFRDIAGFDSLATLGLLAVFDSCFGAQLETDELHACRTLRDVYTLGIAKAGT